MKNTSFKRLWTVTSLKRIRRDLLKQKDSELSMRFLCNASPEFKSIWNNESHRSKIFELAKNFRPKKVFDNHYSHNPLFYGEDAFQIRLAFLEHEIKRLSAK